MLIITTFRDKLWFFFFLLCIMPDLFTPGLFIASPALPKVVKQTNSVAHLHSCPSFLL